MAKLYKRGKIWWVQVNNRRLSTRCTDRKAAELFVRRIERESADPLHAPADPASLEECLNDFIGFQKVRGRSDETIKMNRKHAGHLMRVFGREINVNFLDAHRVDSYVLKRSSEGASPSTIHKEVSTLSGTLKRAVRHGRYQRSVENVIPTIEQKYVPRSRALTLEDLETLCEELTPGRAAHVRFIVGTSARWSESVNALPEDVEENRIFLRGTKTDASRRTVPRLAIFKPLLRNVARHMPFAPWGNVRRDLAVACKNAKLTAVTPNDLRRSSASILRANGVAPNIIAPFMGHTDGRMVERVYGRIQPEDLEHQINRATSTTTVRKKGRKS